jgi:hypothetical protein
MEKDDPKLCEAIKISQNIIKTSADKISHTTSVSINNFLRAASFASTRKKLTIKDIEKIFSIAKNIK